MKKVFLILLICTLTVIPVFGEELDDNYIDLIFDQFDNFSDAEKGEVESILKQFISSDVGLEVIYTRAVEEEDKMAQLGISKSDVRKNIEILKTWSSSDRKALVDAGMSGDVDEVKKLNEKNAEQPEPEPEKPSSGDTSSGGSTGGSAGGYVPPTFVIKDEETPQGFLEGDVAPAQVTDGLISKIIPVKSELKGKTFDDVETHWSKKHVDFLVERGIISGQSESSFAPEAPITKAEIITLVTKLMIEEPLKIPVYTGDASDITAGKWYDGHMQRGVVLNLIVPDENNLLDPMHNSSREEVVEILVRALVTMDIPLDDALKTYPEGYSDFDEIEDSRKEAMAIAINLGFIKGKGDGIIDPKAEIKRSEIAVVIRKLYSYILLNL